MTKYKPPRRLSISDLGKEAGKPKPPPPPKRGKRGKTHKDKSPTPSGFTPPRADDAGGWARVVEGPLGGLRLDTRRHLAALLAVEECCPAEWQGRRLEVIATLRAVEGLIGKGAT